MREPYGEGVATHAGPESCVVARKGADEALTGGAQAGLLSREMTIRGADVLNLGGRPHPRGCKRKPSRDPARSETPRMRASFSRENREIPCSPLA